jgi:hypothetical protein
MLELSTLLSVTSATACWACTLSPRASLNTLSARHVNAISNPVMRSVFLRTCTNGASWQSSPTPVLSMSVANLIDCTHDSRSAHYPPSLQAWAPCSVEQSSQQVRPQHTEHRHPERDNEVVLPRHRDAIRLAYCSSRNHGNDQSERSINHSFRQAA